VCVERFSRARDPSLSDTLREGRRAFGDRRTESPQPQSSICFPPFDPGPAAARPRRRQTGFLFPASAGARTPTTCHLGEELGGLPVPCVYELGPIPRAWAGMYDLQQLGMRLPPRMDLTQKAAGARGAIPLGPRGAWDFSRGAMPRCGSPASPLGRPLIACSGIPTPGCHKRARVYTHPWEKTGVRCSE